MSQSSGGKGRSPVAPAFGTPLLPCTSQSLRFPGNISGILLAESSHAAEPGGLAGLAMPTTHDFGTGPQ